MNTKRIMTKIKEKIALDNFKKDNRRRKNNKRMIIALSTGLILLAGLVTAKVIKENN